MRSLATLKTPRFIAVASRNSSHACSTGVGQRLGSLNLVAIVAPCVEKKNLKFFGRKIKHRNLQQVVEIAILEKITNWNVVWQLQEKLRLKKKSFLPPVGLVPRLKVVGEIGVTRAKKTNNNRLFQN